MPERFSSLAESIDDAGQRARYDAAAKRLIGHKVILAQILKECAEEFKDQSVQFIMDNCIEGEPEISATPLHQWSTAERLNSDVRISGMNTEDASDVEGTVTFDIRFMAHVPNADEYVQVIVNVEIQLANPDYPLVARAIYYCGRLISAQRGTVFTGSDYGKLRKVYSIWICPDPLKRNRNSIIEFGISPKRIIGDAEAEKKDYDKLEIVIISLNDDAAPDSAPIIRLLSTLLLDNETPEDKKRILSDEFNIAMTTELEQGVDNVCNLGQGIYEKGIITGMERGRKQGMEQGMLLVAKNMVRSGDALAHIMEITGLSEATILEQAKAMNIALTDN